MQSRVLSKLPPATIIAVEFDPVRDEAAAYANLLSEEGVQVNYRLHEDTIHGFISMFIDPELAAASTEITRIGETIQSVDRGTLHD